MNLQEYEQIVPHTNAHDLIWLTPNSQCAWRVESLLTKEPDTIAWLAQMTPADVLYDVGANMGQYAMLAAKKGIRVLAFEPESQNFALLCRNIAINQLGHRIMPWPIALSDKPGLGSFFVTQLVAGNSCNAFGESLNFHLQPKEFAFTQGCGGATLDFFATSNLPTCASPTHIKIDVDGFEHKVLAGATYALETVKSVLVETNTALPEHREIAATMATFGLYPDLETAEKARRKEGPFEGIGNVIYYRDTTSFLSSQLAK